MNARALILSGLTLLSMGALAQPTGTLVDPSVPAGVSPNPHTLEGAQLPGAPASTPQPFKPKDKPKAGNKNNHLKMESFVAPVESNEVKQTPVPTN